MQKHCSFKSQSNALEKHKGQTWSCQRKSIFHSQNSSRKYNSCVYDENVDFKASHDDHIVIMKRLMLTPLTQIFSGGVSFSPEAKTGRRRRSKAIFLPTDRPTSIKSLGFWFSQMNFVWHQILLVVLESAVVALLLQLSLPPPPVAPITAGGAVSVR